MSLFTFITIIRFRILH